MSAGQQVEQDRGHALSLRERRLAHRRQLGRHRRGDRRVVEPHEGDVVGHADAGVGQNRQRAAGHEVARDEDGVGTLARFEDGAHRVGAAVGREVAVDDHALGQLPGAQRIAVAAQPVDAGGHRQRSGDGGDVPVAALDEVGRGVVAAADIVDVDVVVALALAHGSAAVDDGHGVGDAVDEGVAGVVRHDDRAVDRSAAHVARGLVARVVVRDEEVQDVVRPAQPGVDARDDRREEGIAEEPGGVFGHDERDGVRLPARK
jgi:hypothetical protein